MSRLRRRHFLQLAGASLGAIGLNQLDFMRRGDRIHRALAQNTPRKLALLVGINGYDQARLHGCVNDVRLQYELLVHRYRFNPQDILIVTDAGSASELDLAAREIITTPNRETIVNAFRDHLVGQAQPEDVALFHYSGHGSYVTDPNPIEYADTEFLNATGQREFEGFVGTLVPLDSQQTGSADTVNDILGSTLFLLSRLVPTENFTTILDCCHAGGGVRGNLVYRAVDREVGAARNPSPAELELQAELMTELGLTETALKAEREAGIAQGVTMGSARANQLAAEKPYHSGFQTGIFTYLLTRYLWQVSETQSLDDVFVSLARITSADEDSRQDPIYFVEPGTALGQRPPYLIKPERPFADAVVRERVDEQTVELWLGGMTPKALKAKDSIYQAIDENGDTIARFQQRGPFYGGLKIEAKCIDAQGNPVSVPAEVNAGTLLREEIRGIPTDFALQVGLHPSLGDDLPAVQQQLEGFNRIMPIILPEDPEDTDLAETDVLLGRFDTTVQAQLPRNNTPVAEIEMGSFGLFENNLTPLNGTFGARLESAGEAIARLSARFRLLLARQALQSMVNDDNTDLNIDMAIGTANRGGIAVVSTRPESRAPAPVIPQLEAGEDLSLVLTNRESDPLFLAVIGTDKDGDLFVYHPSDWNAPEVQAEVGPGESIDVPNDFELPLVAGTFEVLVIASRDQLRDTLKTLQNIARRSRDPFLIFDPSREASRSSEQGVANLLDQLLADVSRNAPIPTSPGSAAVDGSAVAVFSTTITVTE